MPSSMKNNVQPGHPDAVVERVAHGVHARKRRRQCRVRVHDSLGEPGHERCADELHESREDHEVGRVLRDCLRQRVVPRRTVDELRNLKNKRRDAGLLGSFDRARVRPVGADRPRHGRRSRRPRRHLTVPAGWYRPRTRGRPPATGSRLRRSARSPSDADARPRYPAGQTGCAPTVPVSTVPAIGRLLHTLRAIAAGATRATTSSRQQAARLRASRRCQRATLTVRVVPSGQADGPADSQAKMPISSAATAPAASPNAASSDAAVPTTDRLWWARAPETRASSQPAGSPAAIGTMSASHAKAGDVPSTDRAAQQRRAGTAPRCTPPRVTDVSPRRRSQARPTRHSPNGDVRQVHHRHRSHRRRRPPPRRPDCSSPSPHFRHASPDPHRRLPLRRRRSPLLPQARHATSAGRGSAPEPARPLADRSRARLRTRAHAKASETPGECLQRLGSDLPHAAGFVSNAATTPYGSTTAKAAAERSKRSLPPDSLAACRPPLTTVRPTRRSVRAERSRPIRRRSRGRCGSPTTTPAEQSRGRGGQRSRTWSR